MKKTSIDEIVFLLNSLGIKKNDTVFVHSSLFTLGIIEKREEGLYQALLKVIGCQGNIIVPTFTYSFRKNEKFNIVHSPSDNNIGVFSEYLRNKKKAIRSSDPLFSMSSIGPDSKILMKRTSYSCFGKESIYEKLFNLNIKFLCLGITYSTGLTAFMHIEKKGNVPYRYDLKLNGKSINSKNIEYNDYAIHYARDEQNYFANGYTCREKIGQQLEENKISKSINFRYGKHFVLNAKYFEEFVLEKLNKNPLHVQKNIML